MGLEMANTRETIEMQLFDGTPSGIIRCSTGIGNICIAYKIPKDLIKDCKDLEELQFRGIYFLIGFFNGTDAKRNALFQKTRPDHNIRSARS